MEEDGAVAPKVTRRESTRGVARAGEEEGWDRASGGGRRKALARRSRRIVRSPGGGDPPCSMEAEAGSQRKKERR